MFSRSDDCGKSLLTAGPALVKKGCFMSYETTLFLLKEMGKQLDYFARAI
ncbi:MAG: hypothetical protein JRF52_12130 [Deltaproteobacteria bacterium]|nr:hypothetical protein [Deltaproteobacteria bacterium]